MRLKDARFQTMSGGGIEACFQVGWAGAETMASEDSTNDQRPARRHGLTCPATAVTETFGAKSSENADFRSTSAGRVTFVPLLGEAR